MPSLSDSIFLFILALLLFGPKRLPVLARELGKWMGEFRRASNEFKMQMDDELRASEQADRQKQIAAMEAAAPVAPVLDEPEHPHMPQFPVDPGAPVAAESSAMSPIDEPLPTEIKPLPIATSGELSIMPPATGLPVAQSRSGSGLGGLLDSIPAAHHEGAATPETTAHGS